MKKNLIDYQQQELEHIVKYNEYYKWLSFALFIAMILFAIWAVFTDKINTKQEFIIETQKKVFTMQLQQCQAERDTLVWCKEIGIKIN